MSRTPYPSYRSSGVEWLGDVPEHWEVRRLERVASYQTSSVDKKTEDGELPVRLCNYTDVYHRGVIRASDDGFMDATASAREIEKHRLLVGDVVITKDSEDWRDIAVPALVDETADDFVCGYHLGIIRAGPATVPEYLLRAMQSESVNRQFQTAATGVTRYGLPNAAVGDVVVPLPPVGEQRAIAAYLDQETGRIDELLERKRLLVEQLGEYRTALITRVVTRGLDRDAPLKPSGIPWLGDVPEHWQVGRLCRSVTRYDGKIEGEDVDGRPYVGLEHVESWTGRLLPDVQRLSDGVPNAHREGDVLFGKLRPNLAKAFCADFEGLCSTEFLILEPIAYERRYLLYLLLTEGFVSLVDSSTYGAKMPRANWDFVGNIPLPVPPVEEQRAIAAYLDRETGRIDELRAKVEIASERLQEYRTALITAAVTGKIDVRATGNSEPEPNELQTT